MKVRNILAITFVGHSINHSIILLYPVIMIRLADLYPTVSLAQFGLIGTAHYVLYGLMALPGGWLTDRLGARKVLLIYLAGSGGAALLLTLTSSLAGFTAGLALLGTFCGLYHPAGLTLISHHSPSISRHMGVHGIAGSMGLTLGPLLGGYLASQFGWQTPYRLFGLLALVAAVALIRYIPAQRVDWHDEHPQSGRVTRYRPLIYSYIIGIFMGLAHRGTLTFMPLHFAAMFSGRIDPVLMGGLLTALVLASGIIGQITGGRLGERYPRQKILGWVVAANIPSLLLMSYLKGPLMVAAAVVWGTSNFVYQPIANAIVADNSSIRQRGTLFGILNGLSFGVGALASVVGGAVADQWGTAAIFLVMAVLLVPAVVVGLALRRIPAAADSAPVA